MSNEQEMHTFKTADCPSLSGKSTLTYQIACNNDNEVHVALTGNTGKGIFNRDWFDIEEIYSLLSSQKKPITSGSLHGLFENRSSNSAGFILAVLLKEGILKISPGNRHYNLVGQAEYKKVVQALIKTVPDEKPTKKKSSKKGKGVKND
ncbi:MAG: hypothetical protein N2F24_20010 [Deltaproteobacteria bacterium]